MADLLTTDKKKDKDKLAPIPEKTVDKYNITDIPTLKEENSNLVKDISSDKYSTPQQIAMQRRMNRKAVRDAKDTNMVVGSANDKGIDLNKPYSLPVTDSYRKKLVDELGNHVSEQTKPKLSTFVSSIPNPNYIEPPKINVDEEKRKARIQRAAKWADALYAFGEGMQHRTANPDNFAFNRIQAKRDENFNNFKNISELNKKTASDWEFNSRKETLDWIEKQLASETLSASEAKRYKLLYDQLAQQQKQHEDEMKMKGKQLGLQGKELGLKEKELENRIGSDNVSYQSASGQTINRVIPKAEQRDIISRAKINPEFKKYIKTAMNIRYQNIRNADGEIESVPVTELGKEVTDQDLLQAYLRWQTEGSPNENWPYIQNPGQVILPDNSTQEQPTENDPLNLGF